MSYQYSDDPEEQLPDWLKALRKRQRGEAEDKAADSKPEASEEGEESHKPEENAEIAEPPSFSEEEVEAGDPSWLADIRERHQEELENQAAAPYEAPHAIERLDDTKPQAVSTEGEADEVLEESVSQGLDEILAADPPEAEAEEIVPGEIPSWLEALRPGEGATEELSRHSPIGEEGAGPLAGLSGVLPVEPEISQVGVPKSYSGGLEVSRSQQRHRQALEDMLAEENASGETLSPRMKKPMPWLRGLIAFVLLIASLIPLLNASESAALPNETSFPESSAVFNQIEALPEAAIVLVAFDVEVGFYGEMRPVASAVLSHMLAKGVNLHFLSTLPTGPALADRMMEESANGDAEYLNLGYLSGSMAALRSFASQPRQVNLLPSLWTAETLAEIDEISDFDLILLISSDAEDARVWIEQVGPYSKKGMVAATSAQAAPLLYAYLQGDEAMLKGLVGGLQGAAYYEQLSGQEGAARSYWDAQSYVVGVSVVLILLFGLYGRFGIPKPVKKAYENEEDASAS
jgi:hypothetical protein